MPTSRRSRGYPAVVRTALICFVLASWVAPLRAGAGDLEDADDIKTAKQTFDDALVKMNDKCGTKIKATYDLKHELYERELYDTTNKKWYKKPNPDSGGGHIKKGWGYGYGACVLDAIAGECSTDTVKAAVAKKIKKITIEAKFLTKYEDDLINDWEKRQKKPPGFETWEVSQEFRDGIRHELVKGTLKTQIDPGMSNCGQYTHKYIEKKL